jgi:hypothetical protein
VPRFKSDILPSRLLGSAAFGIEVLLLIPFVALFKHHPGLVNNITVSNQPKFYLIEGSSCPRSRRSLKRFS